MTPVHRMTSVPRLSTDALHHAAPNVRLIGYDRATLRRYLESFLRRFFSNQFKRSCTPDAPKVGMVALSPRSDWRMPSDAEVQAWLATLDS